MLNYTLEGNVARITFNSPDTANAITYRMMNDYIAALHAARSSDAQFLLIDAVGPDFCTGRDQKERVPDLTREQNLNLILEANAALRAFEGVSIALIQGRALGFGSGIALHATISVAAESATFGFDEIKHGLAPLVIVAYAPYFIAPRIAQELVITGRSVPATEAREIGIVSRIVAPDQVAATGAALVQELSANLPSAIRLLRRYHETVAAYPSQATLLDAIRQLDRWIADGKP